MTGVQTCALPIYKDKSKRKERKLHSVLTYKMENKQSGCINRDENAVNNMIKIVNTFIKDKTRPEKFRRDYKFLEEQEIKEESKIKKLVKKKIFNWLANQDLSLKVILAQTILFLMQFLKFFQK